MVRSNFLLLLLSLALSACTAFDGAGPGNSGFKDKAVKTKRKPASSILACPDQEASVQLNAMQFEAARELLQRRLSSSSSRAQRYCDLLSLSLAYAMPSSDFHDLSMARQFYADALRLARKGTVPQGAKLFAQTLQQLLTTQGEVYSLQKHNIELRNELSKKEEAIQRLKELTIGNPGGSQ
jgi:hypothetical protein